MSRPSKYPRIGRLTNLKHRQCSYCQHAAIREVHVQTTWTRGDDEVLFVCYDHDQEYGRDPQALLAGKRRGAATEGRGE